MTIIKRYAEKLVNKTEKIAKVHILTNLLQIAFNYFSAKTFFHHLGQNYPEWLKKKLTL